MPDGAAIAKAIHERDPLQSKVAADVLSMPSMESIRSQSQSDVGQIHNGRIDVNDMPDGMDVAGPKGDLAIMRSDAGKIMVTSSQALRGAD